MGSVSAALDENPPAIEKAKTALEEGKELITNRQKFIKIADRSEFGWSTVDIYVENELADNSDDEKRLYRAESRAKRKQKTNEEKKKQLNRKQPFRMENKFPRTTQSVVGFPNQGRLKPHHIKTCGWQVSNIAV